LSIFVSSNKKNKKIKTMENKTIEQIQNEVLELTQKIESVKNNLTELQNKESQKSQIDFGTFMEWANDYFVQKDNVYEIASDLESSIDLDDCCSVDLSLCGNEIEIEKGWRDVDDIVRQVLELAKKDFKSWMISEFNNHTGEEFENNL
jgi:hypothetical protein